MVQKLALLWLYGASIAPSLDRSSPRSLGRSLGQKVDSSLPDNTKNARADGQAGGRTDGRRCHWPENDVFLNITNVCRLLVCEQLSATVCEHFIDHKTLRNRLRYCMWTFHWSLKSFQHPHCSTLLSSKASSGVSGLFKASSGVSGLSAGIWKFPLSKCVNILLLSSSFFWSMRIVVAFVFNSAARLEQSSKRAVWCFLSFWTSRLYWESNWTVSIGPPRNAFQTSTWWSLWNDSLIIENSLSASILSVSLSVSAAFGRT